LQTIVIDYLDGVIEDKEVQIWPVCFRGLALPKSSQDIPIPPRAEVIEPRGGVVGLGRETPAGLAAGEDGAEGFHPDM